MSYILDALKKNKSNNEQEAVPDLSSEHGISGYNYNELEEERALSRWLWPVVVMALLLVVAILTFMLLNPSAQQVSEKIVQQPVNKSINDHGAHSQVINNQDVVKAENDVSRDNASASEDTVITNKPLVVGEPIVTKREKGAVNTTPSTQTRVVNNSNSRSIAGKATAELSKADLPPLVYTTHIYATQPKDRFVLLNGRAYAEGDKTVEGVTIKEILENDLVVIFKGQEFILPSLEDVNTND